MTQRLSSNPTLDPTLRSWVPGSEPGTTDFPIQNLPYGCFCRPGHPMPRLGIAIGAHILDLARAAESGLLAGVTDSVVAACQESTLNSLMGSPPASVRELRQVVSALLAQGSPSQAVAAGCLVSMADAEMLMPTLPRNFSDFFTSIHHARNAGRMSRPDAPLLPNFEYLPVAYHGRASTLRASGTPLTRPNGQFRVSPESPLLFGPTRKLDFECELAIHIGQGNALGEPIALADAPGSIFGIGLLNDWSARDMQAWEAQPLGPFLAKSFLTTLSPWVVSMEALAPFRIAACKRETDAPQLMDHLMDPNDQLLGGINIALEVLIRTPRMRESGKPATCVSTPHFKEQYWTVAQMLTHQTSNGCVVEPGDILGTGTISGPGPDQLGCLLEMTMGGKLTFSLGEGEERTWLLDGDEVQIRGRCEAEGAVPIGFGDCIGTVRPPGLR